MKKTIKVHFVDFSTDFNVFDDHFYMLLNDKYNVNLDPVSPDYIIYSCYGYKHLDFDCVRIFYTAENLRPDFNICDYAIGFDYMSFGDRYLRFPNYARYGKQYKDIANRSSLSLEEFSEKTKFCNFIYSNSHADPMRDRFFQLLSNFKHVDSLGRHLNNISMEAGDRYSPSWRSSKVDVQKFYKFSIAFENSSSPGYTTEKIMHAFAARTIPIYWGNPLILKEFSGNSFVNCHDYDNLNDVVNRVLQINSDDDLCLSMMNAQCFHTAEIPYELSDSVVSEFFDNIFLQPYNLVCRRPSFGSTTMYEKDRKIQASVIASRNGEGRLKRVIRGVLNKC